MRLTYVRKSLTVPFAPGVCLNSIPGVYSDDWSDAIIEKAFNFTDDTGPSPQPINGGKGSAAYAEADQIIGKQGPMIGVYQPEAYARLVGEAA